jgi:hypothetical protein
MLSIARITWTDPRTAISSVHEDGCYAAGGYAQLAIADAGAEQHCAVGSRRMWPDSDGPFTRNGTGVREGVNLLIDIRETAASGATMVSRVQAPPRPAPATALMALANRVQALERELARIKPSPQVVG